MLIKNAVLTDVLIKWWRLVMFILNVDIMIGKIRIEIVINIEELKISGKFIAFTWICTKSFWLLRPADRLFSFKSRTSRGIEPRH